MGVSFRKIQKYNTYATQSFAWRQGDIVGRLRLERNMAVARYQRTSLG